MELELVPRGPFSLAEAARFGFGPRAPEPAGGEPIVRLAFCVDNLRELAGVVLRQDADGTVRGEVAGADDGAAVRAQVARILSLDHDGEAWLEVGRRDPVLGRLQAAHPGLRPVLFHSPYEAAAWSLLAARRERPQAMALRARIAGALGAELELAGERLAAFPTPRGLLELEPEPGLAPELVRRLHGVAEAALAGELDAPRLRALDPEEAIAALRRLRGIGPFYAGLIVVRASGAADALPLQEPRLAAAVARLYGLEAPPDAEALARLAEPWRPFRSWAAVLVRVAAERRTA